MAGLSTSGEVMTLGICSTTIDWDATGSMLQGIGQMATLPLLVWATFVGRQTIAKYRQQHQSEKAVAAAERVLTAAYAARDAIASIRSALIEGGEIERAQEKLSGGGAIEAMDALSRRRIEKLARGQVYYDRLNAAKAEFTALFDAMPMGRAYFGPDVYDALEAIAHKRRIIQVSADSLAEDDNSDKAFSRSIRADLSRSGDDELGKHVGAQVALLEERLLPILRAEKPKKPKKKPRSQIASGVPTGE